MRRLQTITFPLSSALLCWLAAGCAETGGGGSQGDAGLGADAMLTLVDAGPADPGGFIVSGSWKLRGVAATDELCALEGVRRVKLVISHDEDGTVAQELPALCGEGRVQGTIKLRWATTYRAAWYAYDPMETQVQRILVPLPIRFGWPVDAYEIMAADFEPRPRTPGDWELRAQYNFFIRAGAPPDGSTVCQFKRVARVRLTLTPTTAGGERLVLEAPCTANTGPLESEPVLKWNVRYDVLWEALGEDGTVVSLISDRPISANPPTRVLRGLNGYFVWES